jgi:hypothetical protein
MPSAPQMQYTPVPGTPTAPKPPLWRKWWFITGIVGVIAVGGIVAVSAGGEDSSSPDRTDRERTRDTQDESDATEATEPETTEPTNTSEPETTEAPVDTVVASPGTDPLSIQASGFTSIADLTSAGALVTNTGDVPLCQIDMQFNLLDAAGEPIDTSTEYISVIPAGATVAMAPSILGYESGQASGLDISFPSVGECDITEEGAELPLTVQNPTLRNGDFDGLIGGTLVNSSAAVISYGTVSCVYLGAAGEVVGGTYSGLSNDVPPATPIALDVVDFSPPSTAVSTTCSAWGDPVDQSEVERVAPITVANSGFSILPDSTDPIFGALVTNSSATDICSVSVQFNMLAAGIPVRTSTETVGRIPAGATVAIGSSFLSPVLTAPDSMTAVPLRADECGGDFSVYGETVLEVTGASRAAEQTTGVVANPTDALVESGTVMCAFVNPAGQIVGGIATGFYDPIPAGGSIAFEVYEGTGAAPDAAPTCSAWGD